MKLQDVKEQLEQGEIYEVFKVYDCQMMPDDILKIFWYHNNVGNDAYVSFVVLNPEIDIATVHEFELKRTKQEIIISKYLIENGAEIGEQEFKKTKYKNSSNARKV